MTYFFEVLIGLAVCFLSTWLWCKADERKAEYYKMRRLETQEAAKDLSPEYMPMCTCLTVDETMLGSKCWVCGGWIPGRGDEYEPITYTEYAARGNPGGTFLKWIFGQ